MLPYCRYFVKHSLVWTLPVYGLALYVGCACCGADPKGGKGR